MFNSTLTKKSFYLFHSKKGEKMETPPVVINIYNGGQTPVPVETAQQPSANVSAPEVTTYSSTTGNGNIVVPILGVLAVLIVAGIFFFKKPAATVPPNNPNVPPVLQLTQQVATATMPAPKATVPSIPPVVPPTLSTAPAPLPTSMPVVPTMAPTQQQQAPVVVVTEVKPLTATMAMLFDACAASIVNSPPGTVCFKLSSSLEVSAGLYSLSFISSKGEVVIVETSTMEVLRIQRCNNPTLPGELEVPDRKNVCIVI